MHEICSSVGTDRVATPPYPDYFAELCAISGAERFGLTLDSFASILHEIRARYLPGANEQEAADFYRGLRLEELVLARACANGNESAWDCFLTRYRQKLYAMAAAIAPDECAARELADSVYADLFGMRQNEGSRVSKLASYTGRGSLEGWLRTVLAQEYVNAFRRQRRLVSLDEQTSARYVLRTEQETDRKTNPRIEQATDAALSELSGEERLILASYYLDGRTLAEVARMLSVHESTIARRLKRTTASLRRRIVQRLRKNGMSGSAIAEALDCDVRYLIVDVRARLMQKPVVEPFLE